MHELSVCRNLLSQVSQLARENHSQRVTRIRLRIGPLSGVLPRLLQDAFFIARAGTIAESARLEIEESGVRIHCHQCATESEVRPNRLVCENCGDWQTQLVGGDELLLVGVELDIDREH